MNLKRVTVIGSICALSAVVGFILSRPDWLGVGISAISGILYAIIAILALKEDKKPLIGLAVAPVIFGVLIRRQIRDAKLEGLAEYGVALQFVGVAFTVGMLAVGCYLIYQREKNG